jgi:hypothetical protein
MTLPRLLARLPIITLATVQLDGSIVDRRVKPPRPDLVAGAIAPDYALGPHTASLGLAAARGTTLPARSAKACSSASTGRGTGSREAATR